MTARRWRILVVEDSATMRQLLGFALRRLGDVEILEAGDGVEGLKIAREGDLDLALVDIYMPEMDGFKMIQHIRQDPQLAQLPIVIVTTEGKEDAKTTARDLGIKHYITKPINQAKVVDTVRKILQIK